MMVRTKPSLSDSLLLVLYEQTQYGLRSSLTEADLAVLLWKRDKKRWGLPGYEAFYPDNKKVTVTVAHRRFRERGLVERVAYRLRLTPKGSAYCEQQLLERK